MAEIGIFLAHESSALYGSTISTGATFAMLIVSEESERAVITSLVAKTSLLALHQVSLDSPALQLAYTVLNSMGIPSPVVNYGLVECCIF
jgi:hypothetical protein